MSYRLSTVDRIALRYRSLGYHRVKLPSLQIRKVSTTYSRWGNVEQERSNESKEGGKQGIFWQCTPFLFSPAQTTLLLECTTLAKR